MAEPAERVMNDCCVNGFAVKRDYVDVVAALAFLSGSLGRSYRTVDPNG